MQANGITVLWAANAAEARQHVLHIAQKHQATKVTKSKSMVTEEIALNEALEQQGITAIETDLGEYILQLNQEAPSQINRSHLNAKAVGIVQRSNKPTLC